jgi:hypothetical protein
MTPDPLNAEQIFREDVGSAKEGWPQVSAVRVN